ncbi:hypothetical protein FHW84_002481 [Dyella sp. SG562]|uniref:hypothetical protein n=1 Tax=Dyella sp. SG562 TaxID=2587017 RepID=UPI001421F7CD|nr:hypothetical protein [Dyella sp. SG562]NII73908.1 hypothetical protein [Dyella sp. SG562]
MHIHIVSVEPWHVDAVAANMRQEDAKEVMELAGFSPFEALETSLSHPGVSYTALFDGEPAAIFGVVHPSLMAAVGIPWLLGTPLLETHWRAFAKASRVVMDRLKAEYPVMTNVTHADNRLSMRWLRWLGATFDIEGIHARFTLCAR